MKTKLYVLLLMTVCLSLTACRGGKRCDYGQEIVSNTNRTATTLCIDKGHYQLGETVHIELTIRNVYKQALVLEGKPVLNIVIEGGEPYQKRSWAAAYPEQAAALTRLKLAPGETKTITWDWTPQQNNQIYAVRGYWKRSDGLIGKLVQGLSVGAVYL